MQPSFHYLLMANRAIFHKKLLAGLRDTGLTLGQPKVLDYLGDHDGASQKEIATACHIEPASLTSILNRMEERGMVERRMLHGNRRSFYIFLTERGRALQGSVQEMFDSLEEDTFHGISPEDRSAFLRVFYAIYQNLSEEKE